MAQHLNAGDERDLLREQMLQPEELFLLEYLKGANRRSSQQVGEVYELDFELFDDQ